MRTRAASTRLAIGLAYLVAVGCGSTTGADSGGGSETGPGREVALIDLGPGDCFTGLDLDFDASSAATTVLELPCGEPHDHEVFHAFEFGDDGGYPGTPEVIEVSRIGCQEAFARDVGNGDALDQISIWPTESSWAEGDRTVLCAAFARDGDPIVGNIR